MTYTPRTGRIRFQDAESCPICGQDLTEMTSIGILIHALEEDHRDIVFPNHRKTSQCAGGPAPGL